MADKNCPNCGRKTHPQASFCLSCGQTFDAVYERRTVRPYRPVQRPVQPEYVPATAGRRIATLLRRAAGGSPAALQQPRGPGPTETGEAMVAYSGLAHGIGHGGPCDARHDHTGSLGLRLPS